MVQKTIKMYVVDVFFTTKDNQSKNAKLELFNDEFTKTPKTVLPDLMKSMLISTGQDVEQVLSYKVADMKAELITVSERKYYETFKNNEKEN